MARLTKEQATLLADLVLTVRPEWSHEGVMNALREAHGMGTDAEVILAAIGAANVQDNLTPATIAWKGSHWPKGAGPAVGPVTDRVEARREAQSRRRCVICSEYYNRCRELWTQDHTFEPKRDTPPTPVRWRDRVPGYEQHP